MKKQGVGYRDFDNWIRPLSFHQGTLRAATFMTEPVPPAGTILGPGDFLFHSINRYSVLPVRVNDLSHGPVGLLRSFPKHSDIQLFTHSNDHPLPHVHIQCPPGTRETRYQWPELSPLKGDHSLSKAGERRLRQNVKRMVRKLRSVFKKSTIKVKNRTMERTRML
jgi:hypothetical protein